MNACPGEDALYRFLEGELGADEDARIVAHVEDCGECQSHLERMTRGRPSTGEESTVGETCDRPGVDGARTGDCRETADRPRPDDTDEPDPGDQTVDRDEDQTGLAPRRDRPIVRDRRIGDPVHEFSVPGYDILQRLGEGGMGVVYKARHRGLNRLVALKMIRGGSQARTDHRGRFRVEAESVARLRHPNILQIFDIGEAGGLPFVALELLDGGSLADRLGGDPQPSRPAAELMATLAGAVHVAHEAGIIHRDLKPGNILYTSDGVPKITDFGLAKRVDSDDGHTQSGQIMGTPSYMAPEQAKGHSRDVGPAADTYALGAMLYETLTGRPPFKGETPMETVRQVIDHDPVPPSRLVPRLPRDLETICLKCLHKEPSRRYESAAALADDLSRYLRKEPIRARRTPPWERAGKWVRRRPIAAGLAALVVSASLYVASWSIARIRARQELERSWLTLAIRALKVEQAADVARTSAERAADAVESSNGIREAQEQVADVRSQLSRLIDRLKGGQYEREARMLDDRLVAKGQGLGAGLDALTKRQDRDRAALERERAEPARLETFRNRKNQAHFDTIRMVGIGPAGHLEALRASTAAALRVYAADPAAPITSWALAGPLYEKFGAGERAEITEGCYDLLLLHSESVAPAEGLAVLERAERLHPAPTAAHHLRRAACLARLPDPRGRAREEEAARRLKPATALDHFTIGREHLDRGQVVDGVRSLETAIRLDPNQFGAHLLLAGVAFQLGQLAEARGNLHTCIRAAPDLAGLYLFRALVYAEDGTRALGSAGTSPDRRLQADFFFAAAEDDYRRAAGLDPTPAFHYRVLVNRGLMSLRAGRLDQASCDLDEAIRSDPAPYQPYELLSRVRQGQGRHAEALAELDRAIARRPDLAGLFRARALLIAGSADSRKGIAPETDRARYDAAIRDWDRAIGLQSADSPQKAGDRADRGRLLFLSGRSEAALADCEAALKIDARNRKALRLRADALLSMRRYDEVLAACDAALSQGGPSADLLEVRGLARLERRDFAGAIGDYTVAMTLAPGSAALHDHRGWAYLLSDAFKLARADFDEALRLDPDLGDAYGGRALSRVGHGEWREALADAEDAVRLATAARRHRACFNAARVHAHALRFAADEVSRRGESALASYRRIHGRASALLLESARQLPPGDRDAFWRDVVASDPILKPFLPGRG